MIHFSIFEQTPAVTHLNACGLPYISIDFEKLFCLGKESMAAAAYMTLRETGSMRFRRSEKNPARESFFSALGIDAIPLELVHSKTVFALRAAEDGRGAQGDGIITTNAAFVPVITVADCMPIFLANFKTRCFGVLHSGWRGTGIVRDALNLAEREYGADARDFFVIMGPHIQSCCYTVDKTRADYFQKEFSPDCVQECSVSSNSCERQFHLSLAAANEYLLTECGVPQNHIALSTDCTSCDTRLGSFRREGAFTAMAAFMRCALAMI